MIKIFTNKIFITIENIKKTWRFWIPTVIVITICSLNYFLKNNAKQSPPDFFNKKSIFPEYPLDEELIKLRLEGFLTEITKTESDISSWPNQISKILNIFYKNFDPKFLIVIWIISIICGIGVMFYIILKKYQPSEELLQRLILTEKSELKGFWQILFETVHISIWALIWIWDMFTRWFNFGTDGDRYTYYIFEKDVSFSQMWSQKRAQQKEYAFGYRRSFQWEIFNLEILSKINEPNSILHAWLKINCIFVYWICAHIFAARGLIIPKISHGWSIIKMFIFSEIFLFGPRYFAAIKDKLLVILKNYEQLAEKVEVGPFKIYLEFVFTDAYLDCMYMIFCHIAIHLMIVTVCVVILWIYITILLSKKIH